MRLYCALVSTFVPIVLADYRPEKHQPRFLSKKNINDASDNNLVPWAGAFLLEGNLACLFRTGGYTNITGTFIVPLAWDGNNTGVSIAVGIGGLCQDPVRFAVGIDVFLDDNTISYAAGAQWGSQVKQPSVDIATGHFIRASVRVDSATTGFASLENLSNGQSWSDSFAAEPAVCQKSVEWGVSALTGYPKDGVPVPKFSTVTFVNAKVKTAHGASAPWLSGGANVTNMEYNNMMLTTGMANNNLVVVARKMGGE